MVVKKCVADKMQRAGGLRIGLMDTDDWYAKCIRPAKFDAQAGRGMGYFRDHKIARRQNFFRVDGRSIMRKDKRVICTIAYFL